MIDQGLIRKPFSVSNLVYVYLRIYGRFVNLHVVRCHSLSFFYPSTDLTFGPPHRITGKVEFSFWRKSSYTGSPTKLDRSGGITWHTVTMLKTRRLKTSCSSIRSQQNIQPLKLLMQLVSFFDGVTVSLGSVSRISPGISEMSVNVPCLFSGLINRRFIVSFILWYCEIFIRLRLKNLSENNNWCV